MKTRIGFVSNSSSSSFVLAIRNDITEADKEEIFNKHIKESFDTLLEDFEGYGDEDDKLTEEEAKSRIFNVKGGLVLDNWTVIGGECNSESGIKEALFYYMCNVDTPKFKYQI